MPSVVGAVNINSVEGTANFGDAFNLSPKSTTKSFTGAGGNNNGNVVNTVNGVSSVNNFDPHVADQVQIGNI